MQTKCINYGLDANPIATHTLTPLTSFFFHLEMNAPVVNSIGADKGLRNGLSVRELHARLPLKTKKKPSKPGPGVVVEQSANAIHSGEPVSPQQSISPEAKWAKYT